MNVNELETGDTARIAYDSPQASEPVEKTAEVVYTSGSVVELVLDEDDEGERRVKISLGRTDYKGRNRVASKLWSPETAGGDWRHGSDLGNLVEVERLVTDGGTATARAVETDGGPTVEADDEFEQALDEARAVARYDEDAAAENPLLPEDDHKDASLAGTLAWLASPSTYVLRTAVREPDEDEVDGAAPGDDAPRAPRTFLLDGALDDEAEDDEAVDEDDLVFRVVTKWTNSYDDERVVVETPAPWETPDDVTSPNEVIKSLEWGDHHYAFDDDDRAAPSEAAEAWSLDKSGAAPLKEAAEAAGYEWVVEYVEADEDDDEDEQGEDVRLNEVAEFVEDGDRVTVRYLKKNGNGVASKAGEVRYAHAIGTDRYGAEPPEFNVKPEAKSGYRVRLDDHETPSIFSSGHYPYMGEVVSVEVEPSHE